MSITDFPDTSNHENKQTIGFVNKLNSFGVSLSEPGGVPFSSYERVLSVLILIIAVIARSYFLNQPMRYDESFSFIVFADRGIKDLFHYPLPNNQLLHTIFVKIAVSIFGPSPASIRLPAFVAGIAIVPTIFIVCRKLSNERSGLLAAASIAVSPYMILYSTTARGYTLMVFLILLLILSCLWYLEAPSKKRKLLIAVFAALSMFTIPSALFAVAGIFVWLLILSQYSGNHLRSVIWHIALPLTFLSGILTVFLYMPSIIVTGNIEHIINNRFVTSLPWSDFLGQILPHISESYFLFIRDIPLLIVLLYWCLALYGVFQSVRMPSYPPAFLIPCVALGVAIVFFFKHSIPFARTWIFLIPIILIMADIGLSTMLNRRSKVFQTSIYAVLIVIAALYSQKLISMETITKYPDTGIFPEAAKIAERLGNIMAPDDTVVADAPADWPLYYYLYYQSIPQKNSNESNKAAEQFIVVLEGKYELKDLTDESASFVFSDGGVTIYKTLPR